MANRTHRVYVRMSQDERIVIEEKAGFAGLSISEYIRRSALDKVIREKPSLDFLTLITELRSTGSTLYELLLKARTNRFVDPELLEGAVHDNRSAEKQVVDAFTKLWL